MALRSYATKATDMFDMFGPRPTSLSRYAPVMTTRKENDDD